MIRSRVPTPRRHGFPGRVVAGATLLAAVLTLGPGLPAEAVATRPAGRTSTYVHAVARTHPPTTTVGKPDDWWW